MAASQPIPSLTTAEIMDEIWLGVAREYGEPPAMSGVAPQMQQAIQTTPSPPGIPSHQDREAPAMSGAASQMWQAFQTTPSLQRILGQDGMAFVEAAYATILRRPPDPMGASYFLTELAAGRSKIILLGQLRNSAEGRRLGVEIPGLRRRYAVHRLYAMPFVGPVTRVGGAGARRIGLSHALAGRSSHENDGLEDRFWQLQSAIDLLNGRLASVQAAQEVSRKAVAMTAEYERRLGILDRQATRFDKRLGTTEDSVIASLLALADRVARLDGPEALQDRASIVANLEAAVDAVRRATDERLNRIEADAMQSRREMVNHQRRVGLLLETLRRRAETPVSKAEFTELDERDDHTFDSLYVSFEDRFRGTRADIKQRQRFYLPILEESQAGTPERPIVDVGCGRGEFLELMRDEHLTAHGVDLNESMAEACRANGLDCVTGDALAYLAKQAPGSLGAVTGFHIIEHLPFKVMVRMFDEALRALAPGGVMVFETPNPANLLVASRWFYMDPTHRNPLPGEMVAMIAEARGFTRISIVELHPTGLRFGGNDPVLQEELDGLFHGPQDYALLARKP
jgi:SAM-dependent methyltransferase